MMAAIGTLMIDTIATGYFTRAHTLGRAAAVVAGSIAAGEAEKGATDIDVDVEGMMYHVHTHATHGHSNVVGTEDASSSMLQLIRHRIIAQVPHSFFKLYYFHILLNNLI